jgi:hypothetical protein
MRDKFFLSVEFNAPATVAARGALGIDIDSGIAYTVRATRTAEQQKGPALQLSRIAREAQFHSGLLYAVTY